MIEIIALASALIQPKPLLVEVPKPKPITIELKAEIAPVASIKPLQPIPKPKPKPITARATKPAVETRRVIPGNSYSPGYCTWFAKSKRADLPNNLGNAVTWLSRAAAQGYSTGSTPRVGAVAWQGGGLGHVAIVTGVSGNMVTIREMNFKGRYIVSSRTVPSSTFKYIY